MATVRLRGRVRGASSGAVVVRRAELVVEGGERQSIDEGDGFDLVLDDGAAVCVKLVPATTLIPMEAKRGRWSALEGEEGAALFRRHAPAPHVEVERLAWASLRDGDAIELAGEPTQEADIVDGSDYRTAGGRRVSSVQATHVASGEDAARQIDRVLSRSRRGERSLLRRMIAAPLVVLVWLLERLAENFWTVWCVVFVAAALFAFRLAAVYGMYLQSFALGALGFAAFRAHRRGEPAHFTTGKEHAATYFFWWGIFFPPVFLALPAVVVLWLIVAVALNGLSSRRTARRMRVLVTTPPFPADRPAGAWGSATGTVVDVEKDAELAPSKLSLQTAQGPLEVLTAGAPWTSFPTAGGRSQPWPGSRILLVGRIERSGDRVQVSYSGADALMLYATPPQQDPLLEARAYLARRRRTYVLMIVLALAASISTIWMLGRTTPGDLELSRRSDETLIGNRPLATSANRQSTHHCSGAPSRS